MINYYTIVSFFSLLFSCVVFLFSYKYFSDSKLIIGYRLIISIIITSILITINNLYNDQYLKVPVASIISLLFFQYIYKRNFIENLYLTNFICFLSLLVEFILSVIVSVSFSDIYSINHNPLIKLLFTLLCFWIYYFTYKIPILKTVYNKLLQIIHQQKNIIGVIYLFLFIIGILFSTYTLDFKDINNYVFSLISISFFCFLIYCYLQQLHDNIILNLKNKNLIESQIVYNNTLDDFRLLKHNLLNDFLFISSLCDEKTQSIIKEKISKYHIDICNFNDLKNLPEGLQGILYFKSSLARKNRIDLYIDCDQKNQYINLDKRLYIDLCEVISITIDNALEASKDAKSKAVYVNILDSKNVINIEILNTYINEIDLDNIGNKNYSTKNRNSGLGLNYIKKLNKKIDIKTSFVSDLFKIRITVKK